MLSSGFFGGHLVVVAVGLFLAVVLAVSHESFSRHEARLFEASIGEGAFLAKPSSLKGKRRAFVCSSFVPAIRSVMPKPISCLPSIQP